MDLLPRAIDSVLIQGFDNFEIIVVDDASTDKTHDIAQNYKNENITFMFLEKHGGAARARNVGIKVAKGEFIAFQDSDDQWLPDKLEKQMAVFEKSSADVGVVYCDMWKVGNGIADEYVSMPRITPENGIIYQQALAGKLMGLGLVSVIIRRECFNKVGLFDEKLQRHMDLELLMRISKYYLFAHIPEPLVKYCLTKNSISLNLNSLLESEKLIFKKYYNDIAGQKGLLGKYLYNIGTLSCQLGQMREGRKYILRALKAVPTNLKFIAAFVFSLFGKKIYRNLIVKKNLFFKKTVKEKNIPVKSTILFVVHTTVIGGAELYLLKVLKHLNKNKFSPVVIVPDDGCLNQRLKQIGVQTQIVALGPFQRKNPFPHIRSIINLFRQIVRYKPLIVHSFTRPAQYYCAWAAKLTRTANICHFHDIINWDDYTKFSKWSVSSADIVIAVSLAAKECLLKGNIQEEKIVVINNGIDPEEISQPADIKKIRMDFNLKEKGLLVAAVGRIVPEKGFDVFIRAAAEVLKNIPDVKFIIVGEEQARLGSSYSYLNNLKLLVKELDIESNLSFTGFREDVLSIIKSVDLLVLSSIMDACPTVILEAMALAKPVVASRVGGIPEMVEDNITGVLFSNGNFQELAKHIIGLLSDEEYRLRLGESGKNKVKKSYLIKEKVCRIEECYNKFLKNMEK